MWDLIYIIAASIITKLINLFFRHRRDLEVLLLRKEVQVLRRQVKKPKFTNWDRLFMASIFKANSKSIENAILVKPSTIIAWHRKLVKWRWTHKSKNVGRPPVNEEVVGLIFEMKKNNRRWRCRKIQGELRKLGIKVGKTKISEVLKQAGFDPGHRNSGLGKSRAPIH